MTILEKYAHLLINYCVDLQKGERLFVKTTLLAEPLVKELYRAALRAGGFMEVDFSFDGQSEIFFEEANEDQLKDLSPFNKMAIENFDAYIVVRAPYTLDVNKNTDPAKQKLRQEAMAPVNQTYFKRTASRSLKRSLCQYPTQACADAAGMTLDEYSHFVFNACNLYEEDPQAAWLKVRADQQKIVDFLNDKDVIRYVNNKSDVSFSVKDRVWINSDGQTNMPSGEVFTGPIEDSVNGIINFSFPSIYMGKEVEDITLHIENGQVVKWTAEIGQELLDKIMEIDGARYFGEVAIGTNYQIQRATKNILFDEKIGGTIHMAVGQSYHQTGGKNKSAIHWDMITDMKNGGAIYADEEKIYENGKFIIFD